MLGLTASDERHGSGIRYETQGGSWFLVYRSEFAGTAKSTCMRFEVEDVESAVRQLRARGIVFEKYDLPDVKTVDGIQAPERRAGRVVQGSRRERPPDRAVRQVMRFLPRSWQKTRRYPGRLSDRAMPRRVTA